MAAMSKMSNRPRTRRVRAKRSRWGRMPSPAPVPRPPASASAPEAPPPRPPAAPRRAPRLGPVGGAALGFTALAFALFAPFLFAADGWVASSPIGDITRYFVFVRGYYAEEILSGRLPLWSPNLFSGFPFAGTFQTAIFHPLNVIYLLLPLQTALNADLMIHVALFGTFTFVWLHGRGLAPPAAAFGGLMVALGAPTFLRVLAGQLTVLGTLAWLPLLLHTLDRLKEKVSLGPFLIGMGAGGAMLLAGHPPTAFMAGLFTIAYCVPSLVRLRFRRRLLMGLVGVGGGALGLAAVQVFLGLDAAAESTRALGTSYDFATSFSMPPENLLTLLVPEALGNADAFKQSYFGRWFYWDASLYVGLVGLLLALHGVVRGGGRLRVGACVAVPLLVVLSLGRYTPVYAVLYHYVPGFDLLRAPSKLLFFAALMLAALAAMGVDALWRERGRVAPTLVVGAALALAALVLGVWTLVLAPDDASSSIAWLASLDPERVRLPRHLLDWQAKLGWGALASAGGLAGGSLLLGLSARRRWALWALLAIGAVELAGFAWQSRGGTRMYAEYLRRPGLSDAYTRAGPDRATFMGWSSNLALHERGHDVWGNESVVGLRYAELIARSQGRSVESLNNIGGDPPDHHHPLLAMLRTRVMVDRAGSQLEYSDVLPRFLFVGEYRVIPDREERLEAIAAPDFDPRRTVILEEPLDTLWKPPREGAAVKGNVNLLEDTGSALELRVDLPQHAILLITDAWADGWRVRGIGRSKGDKHRLLPADHALRAIPLQPGTHHLRVEYAPLSYRAGATVSGLCGLLYSWTIIVRWRRRRREAAARARAAARAEAPGPLG